MKWRLDGFGRWPVLRQIRQGDLTGLGSTAMSQRTEALVPRTRHADAVVRSICPYCAVGCGQRVYVEKGKISDIEGDPQSPISRGRLCPKGAATFQLVTGSHRTEQVLHRRPGGKTWERIPLDRAMELVAERVKRTRDETWEERGEKDEHHPEGKLLRRTMGIAHLGGATLDNEENYLLKKLYSCLGVLQVENQARI
jgi:formate dehydrogenase major subunit